MIPISGGISPDRLFTFKYKSLSSVKLAISLGTSPYKELKCKYKPVKCFNPAIAGDTFP
jgi:hypothetical protein